MAAGKLTEKSFLAGLRRESRDPLGAHSRLPIAGSICGRVPLVHGKDTKGKEVKGRMKGEGRGEEEDKG